MKREIKFRAWDYETPNFPIEYDADSIGTIKFNFGENLHYINTIGLYVNAEDEVCNGFMTEYLEQFTGLQDKNGVDIYEGDICKHPNGEILEVKWLNDDGRFCAGKWYSLKQTFIKLEVIGNIHQQKL